MTLYLLPSTAGNDSVVSDSSVGPTEASGYTLFDLITGPRSTMCVTTSGANHDYQFAKAGYFAGSATIYASHCVIARMDWAKNNSTALSSMQVLRAPGGGGAWTAAYGPTAVGTLIGVRDQDYVVSFTRAIGSGWRAYLSFAGATENQLSKIYISDGYTFGIDPTTEIQVTQMSESQYVTPIKATRPYEIEAVFNLTWRHVTLAKLTEFREIAQLFYWPLFLYDDAINVIPWQLEHVIVTGWTEVIEHLDSWRITVNFARLRHYY
mgnify:CR=1 FL=1